MPANKDAEMRYRILDRLLGDKHRKYTIYDLLEVVNDQLMDYTGKSVSLHTLQKDIEELGTDLPSGLRRCNAPAHSC